MKVTERREDTKPLIDKLNLIAALRCDIVFRNWFEFQVPELRNTVQVLYRYQVTEHFKNVQSKYE